MDGRRFDALARALTAGSSRRRLLQLVPGLAVGSLLPRAGSVRALDGGDVVGCPTPTGGRACTGGADCAPGEICLNGFCATSAAAGSAGSGAVAQPTASAPSGGATTALPASGGTQSATEVPAAADGGEATAVPEAADGGEATVVPEAAGGGQEATSTPRAVTTPDGTGGQDDDPTPTPTLAAEVATPATLNRPLATQLHEGVCGSLEATPAFPLIDIGAANDGGATPVADGAPDGQSTALPAGVSMTIVEITLSDLLSGPFAIDVRLDADDPESSIACGDVGAPSDVPRPDDALAIGLTTRNGSGAAGIAFLQDEGERVVVNVFVAPGLAGAGSVEQGEATAAAPTEAVAAAPGFAAGLTVVVTEEVNLRAAPSSDAAIVGALPAGQQLTVRAAQVEGWVPVSDPATGRPGYVSAEYLALAEGE